MFGTLIDSTVIINHLQRKSTEEAKDLLESSNAKISIITYLEVSNFMHKTGKTEKLEEAKQLLKSFEIIPLTLETCDLASKISHSNKMSLTDAIIYATAKLNKLRLATADSDFIGKENETFLKPRE